MMNLFEDVKLNSWDSKTIESAMRKHSSRRHHRLDFVSSAYLSLDQRYFLGYENETEVTFTRARSSYEMFLPKIIIAFSKNDFTVYKVRMSLGYWVVCLFLAVFTFLGMISVFRGNNIGDVLTLVFLLVCVYYLAKLEIRRVNSLVQRTITNYKAS